MPLVSLPPVCPLAGLKASCHTLTWARTEAAPALEAHLEEAGLAMGPESYVLL